MTVNAAHASGPCVADADKKRDAARAAHKTLQLSLGLACLKGTACYDLLSSISLSYTRHPLQRRGRVRQTHKNIDDFYLTRGVSVVTAHWDVVLIVAHSVNSASQRHFELNVTLSCAVVAISRPAESAGRSEAKRDSGRGQCLMSVRMYGRSWWPRRPETGWSDALRLRVVQL